MTTFSQARDAAHRKDKAVAAALKSLTVAVECALGFSLGHITTVILRGTQLQATMEPGVTTVYAIKPAGAKEPTRRTKRRRSRPAAKE